MKRKYRKALVLGKFMPIHHGHEAMINYATSLADEVIVLVCTTENEPFDGHVRYELVRQIYRHNSQVVPLHLTFNERDLPSTSVPARDISQLWAEHIKKFVPEVDVFVSSEFYGEIVAEYMGIENEYFDPERVSIDISATEVRENPYEHWDKISQPVRDFFFRKVVLLGTESTGKSVLTKKLAERFNSSFVHEVGRDIVSDLNACTQEDLMQVAQQHAKNIIIAEQQRNRVLFIDTDINITRSYYGYLFKDDMLVDGWMKLANKADLYIYLEADAPYIQDGTRLSKKERLILDQNHKLELAKRRIQYFSVYGTNWDERESQAIDIIHRELLLPNTTYKMS